MTLHRTLRDDARGASTVEIALVLPVLILFIYGIFIVGTMFQANAGMQHALGEGARFANIYPTPTNAQIKTRMDTKVFGSAGGTFTSSVADAPSGSSGYKTLTVTYQMPVNFLFFVSNDLNLTRTKKVYIAS